MPKNNITLADVAQHAGVSTMTASRALNNKGDVNPETREKIRQAAEALGYRPNSLARSLATNRSTTIGLVVPDIANPFFSEIARGVEDEAHSHGYNIFLCNFDEDPQHEQAALNSLAEKQVDGLILCSSRQEESDLQTQLKDFRHCVLINRSLEESQPHTAAILLDDHQGALQAACHLLNHQRRRIAFLAGPPRSRSGQKRLAGYRDSLIQHGLPFDPALVRHCQPDMHCGKQTTLQLLNTIPTPDAILAFNDLIALGAVQACLERGLRIPHDIEMIGFDDIPLAALITPTLTTLAYPKKEIGRRAMQTLLAMSHAQAIETVATYAPSFIFRQTSPE